MISNPFTKEPLHSIIIHQVKAPLVALLNTIDALLPMPTKEMVRRKNSKLLVEHMEWFFEHWIAKVRAMRAIAKLCIIVYDYDSPYTYGIHKLVERFIERIGEWQPESESESDSRSWKESELINENSANS